jgi:hypothetical protein
VVAKQVSPSKTSWPWLQIAAANTNHVCKGGNVGLVSRSLLVLVDSQDVDPACTWARRRQARKASAQRIEPCFSIPMGSHGHVLHKPWHAYQTVAVSLAAARKAFTRSTSREKRFFPATSKREACSGLGRVAATCTAAWQGASSQPAHGHLAESWLCLVLSLPASVPPKKSVCLRILSDLRSSLIGDV